MYLKTYLHVIHPRLKCNLDVRRARPRCFMILAVIVPMRARSDDAHSLPVQRLASQKISKTFSSRSPHYITINLFTLHKI